MRCPKCESPIIIGLDDIEVCPNCGWSPEDNSDISREWAKDEHGWFSPKVEED